MKTKKEDKTKEKSVKGDVRGLLMENFVLLQKTLVETVAALKQLDKKVTSLLELFEEASKSFKESKKPSEVNIMHRLEKIEEQNSLIAKTLVLLQKEMATQTVSPKTSFEEERESIAERIRPKKKKIIKKIKKESEEEESEEPLFKEEFGSETTEEESETESGEEEFKPKPLPEFSF